ncbi:phosphohistidine phosphatase SixA [Nitrososphaera sp.]|uniref:phosphohistidine phosphatase SixA n=1 Tax=Nitrososphaera sp. TaxID=1971748 RepID=UPI0018006FC2|nr:phosphohistidine phosphatase SixA [Nitrososphaera sp.]NWG36537.1 phosphohistidine phosphatase SixA [Nitrososphaera sp.]
MELYVLRHGEAGKRLAAGSKDSERALTVAGEKEVEEIAGAIAKLGVRPDIVATSPLARSHQTAAIVAKKLKIKNRLQDWDELKPEGSRTKLYERLAKLKPEASVMVVGHEPYLSTLVSELAFDGQKGRIVMKKAGLARVGVTSFRPNPKGELRWLLTPRIMKRVES